MNTHSRETRPFVCFLYFCSTFCLALASGTAAAQDRGETEIREKIAAASMEDAVVVDCQLPGKLRKLGGTRTYLTPGLLVRTSAVTCRSRGGEYTLGDLSSGTLSLQRWLEPAENGEADAQYYVARIYANGMDNVPIDYTKAAAWYDKASVQGHSEAMQELGYLYERGLGVQQDSLKALNLQRRASGLGDDLDYAYKVADAEALVAELTGKLDAANGALRESQLAAQQAEARLADARRSIRAHEQRTARLVAELRTVSKTPGAVSDARTQELRAELDDAKRQLATTQATVVDLERERDAVTAKLSLQMIGGQATQLELRELRARTETAEQKVEQLAARLAENQQRLIQTDEELRELQAAHRNQSDQLASDLVRLSAARSQTQTDAAAYIAAQEARLESKSARVAMLEAEVATLRDEVSSARGADQTTELRQALDNLRARYEAEVAQLQSERARLEDDYGKSEEQLNALFTATRQQLRDREAELRAGKTEIDTLATESDRLRARVSELETAQAAMAQRSGQQSIELQSQIERARQELARSQQEAVSLRNQLATVQAEKSTVEAELASNRIELNEALAAGKAASEDQVGLLRAQIAASQSTIKAKDLRIQKLEREVSQLDLELDSLRADAKSAAEAVPVDVRNAQEVLELARSSREVRLGKYHALIIANEDYRHLDSLKTPVRDALEVNRLLVERYGFNVEMLKNATRDDIMRKLHSYANRMTPEDNLLIYYAGRGSTPDTPPPRAFWLGVDAEPDVGTGMLLAEAISDKIAQIEAQRILVVTDSCFSKRRLQANSLTVGRGLDPKRFKLLAKFKSRNVLTSGANEPFFDARDGKRHSLFAHYFLEVLRRNQNVLSGEMLYFEMAQRIRDQANDPEAVTPSYTSLQGAGHRAGDFFFVPAPSPTMMAGTSGQDTNAYR